MEGRDGASQDGPNLESSSLSPHQIISCKNDSTGTSADHEHDSQCLQGPKLQRVKVLVRVCPGRAHLVQGEDCADEELEEAEGAFGLGGCKRLDKVRQRLRSSFGCGEDKRS